MDFHSTPFTLLTALAEMGAMCNFVYLLTYMQPLIVTVAVQGVALGSLPMPSTPSIVTSLAMLLGVGMAAAGSTDSVEEVNLDQAVAACNRTHSLTLGYCTSAKLCTTTSKLQVQGYAHECRVAHIK
mmetsp:Transcript_47357/g.102822  ORF Transcript_47357/g.102822 Transcript_47357/m.102822 type:complete len:127 (+) Transcript_47357:1119-1499(+)